MKNQDKQMLALVAGLPGTGKTTFALALASITGFSHLNTDKVRHDMGKTGIYDPETKKAVYFEILKRASTILANGKPLIIDATFHKNQRRLPFEDLANKHKLQIYWIEVKANETTIRERMKTTRKYSEADFDVYQKIKSESDPLDKNQLILWSDRMNIQQMIDEALFFFSSTTEYISHEKG